MGIRTIMFRGKRKDNDEWIEGSAINTQYDVRGDEHIYMGVLTKSGKYPLMRFITWFEVIPETVGQYTGKELNGEKLFEGDILEGYEDYDDSFGYPVTNFFKAFVCWDEENFCWALNTDGFHQGFNDCSWDYFTKVGNIHDNPELLEGADTDA